MKLPRRSLSPLPLAEPWRRRLDSYTLAATAAGVGTLALALPAEGKIVYTPAHLVMSTSNPQHFYPLDVNHDGVKDFSFSAYAWTGMSSQEAFLRCNPSFNVGNAVLGNVTSLGRHEDEGAFLRGVRVGAGPYASHDTMAFADSVRGNLGFQGPWANGGKGVKDRYLGLKFAINGKTHYGWARLNVKVGYSFEVYIKATLTGYAYETVPNKAIITGETKGKDVITLQPASLGALAAGAAARHTLK